jgi:hypothetical protein
METIVVRPSERAAEEEDKLSYEEIKRERLARGFAASPCRAGTCNSIWVVRDDCSEAFVATVIDATPSIAPSRKVRSDITFDTPTIFAARDIPPEISQINWTSNNVRYLKGLLADPIAEKAGMPLNAV